MECEILLRLVQGDTLGGSLDPLPGRIGLKSAENTPRTSSNRRERPRRGLFGYERGVYRALGVAGDAARGPQSRPGLVVVAGDAECGVVGGDAPRRAPIAPNFAASAIDS